MDYAKSKRGDYAYKSLFWPAVLIGAGIVWLLINLNIISASNLSVLGRLWPLMLIATGLDLLFGRRSPISGAMLGVGAVVIVVALIITGPALGLVKAAEVKTEQFSEPVGDAESAHVVIRAGVADLDVIGLDDSAQLIDANVTAAGDVDFSAEGQTNKTIRLEEQEDFFNWSWNPFGWMDDDPQQWQVGLNDNVPLDLEINAGVGNSTLDLSELKVTGLQINSGVGNVQVNLPEMDNAYTANIEGGVGNIDTNIPENAVVDLRISTGPGNIVVTVAEGASGKMNLNTGPGGVTLDLPEGAAARIEANTGVGNIHLPANFQRISGGEGEFVGANGVWQTAEFDDSAEQIIIHFEGGVGDLTVR